MSIENREIESLKQACPKLFAKFEEEITEVRYLLVIDMNYDDDDSDEFDAIDPEDYNFLVYTTELLQETIKEPLMIELVKKLKIDRNISEFHLSDIDLYGIQTELDEEGIALMVLRNIEELL
jgi:hypothetical protein